MVRSILLRGFDQDMANKIGEHMEEHGVKFIRQYVPIKVGADMGRCLASILMLPVMLKGNQVSLRMKILWDSNALITSFLPCDFARMA